MEEIIDLIALDSPPTEITDKIKDALFIKASEKINSIRPEVASSIFGIDNAEDDE